VLCGFITALEYLIVTIYALEILEVSDDYVLKLPKITYYFRTVYLFITGITAGFIGREMKRGIYKSFDNMFEKRKMESLFGQQVEPEVVKTLLQESEKSKIIHVTVLFFDIRNFTSYADIRTPEEIISFQNHLFGPIVNIIHKHDGIVNQILGDGIMATFGAPVQLLDHSQKAFNASLDILSQTEELSASGVIPEIKIGMGLHSGPVVAGNIGDDSRKQYSISGTTVIIAARIEQLNKKHGTSILISDAVKKQIKSDRELISLGTEKLKGLEKGIEIYRIG
jgi:adenylate cyclase